MSPIKLRQAVHALRAGGVVAYPTEAVWGLGCDPSNFDAFSKLLSLKQREVGKGVIVIASHFKDLEPWLEMLDERVEERAFRTWPGPVTWLWPASPEAPSWITGGRNRIAIRIPAHPVARALCDAFGPVVSTSANRAGRPAARSATQVRLAFGDRVDAILPGAVGNRLRPTPIRDLVSGMTLRA